MLHSRTYSIQTTDTLCSNLGPTIVRCIMTKIIHQSKKLLVMRHKRFSSLAVFSFELFFRSYFFRVDHFQRRTRLGRIMRCASADRVATMEPISVGNTAPNVKDMPKMNPNRYSARKIGKISASRSIPKNK